MKPNIKIFLLRTIYEEKQVLGNLILIQDTDILFSCKTLELAWNNNTPQISCVPSGIYPIVLEYSPSFKMDLWELKEVPNRSEVKIHSANYNSQLLGCVGLGKEHTDINNDGFRDIISSKDTLGKFHYNMNFVEKYYNGKTTINIIGDGRDSLVI